MFVLKSQFTPTGDQPQAIEQLISGIKQGLKNQVLLGVTGSGKTFTMANMIYKLQMPALIISHNKTLAGQLYQEMREFFPKNAVSYFISYYDFYQPEAYIPHTDTYIEKEAQINQLIDKLRLQSTTNILTRQDVIVVASVSCIYNIGSPQEYQNAVLILNKKQPIKFQSLLHDLGKLQYERSDFEFRRGSFRIRGEYLDIYPAYEDVGIRMSIKNNLITDLYRFNQLTGKKIDALNEVYIYPAKHFMTDPQLIDQAEKQIRADLKKEYQELKNQNKIIEAERLLKRVNYDLEIIKEVGYVNGIENYSRYYDGRRPGDPPFSLLHFFQQAYGKRFLVFIDESHMTIPQLRGMYNGDYSRKKTLIDYGFRLKAALDNRPLRFDEFYQIPKHIIYVSATPDDWEINQSQGKIVEQLIRPTGIVDPQIEIRSAQQEIFDLLTEIKQCTAKKERVLVTTLTKKTAEDLNDFLKQKKIKTAYLHSDIKTLERSTILERLRKNEYDVLIGVNLLREGLDLPEVALVAILDADREGFLRSKTALIQTMGRAARNINGKVIIYADAITKSIKNAVAEIERRRKHQLEYNKKYQITPKNVIKPIREKIIEEAKEDLFLNNNPNQPYTDETILLKINPDKMTPYDKHKIINKLARSMRQAAQEMNFELAIKLRDKIKELKVNN
jgi:excinuclease ABC subunit B